MRTLVWAIIISCTFFKGSITLGQVHAMPQLKEFTDPEGRFKISFPQDWELKLNYPTPEEVVCALSPLLPGDSYRENVTARIVTDPDVLTPEEVGDQLEPLLKGNGTDFEEISRKDVTIHGLTGTEITFRTTYDMSGTPLRVEQRAVVLTKSPYAIMLFCSAMPDSYAAYSGTFDHIANSVQALK